MAEYFELLGGGLFAAGVVAQAFLMARDKRVITETLPLCLFLVVIGAAIALVQGEFSAGSMLVLFALVFAGVFSEVFKKEALPVVSELTLVTLNITLVYAFFSEAFGEGIFWAAATAVALVITVVALAALAFEKMGFGGRESLMGFVYTVLLYFAIIVAAVAAFLFSPALEMLVPAVALLVAAYLAGAKLPPGAMLKPLLYAWFVSAVLFASVLIYLPRIAAFFSGKALFSGPVESLTAGMLFTYLAFYAWQAFELLPLPGKHQSFKSRMEDWHEHVQTLAAKYSSTQLEPLHGLALISVQAGALYLNSRFNVIEPLFAIELLLLLSISFSQKQAGDLNAASKKTGKRRPKPQL